ncbi:MAG: DUF362 domain-containing protein [Bacteroidales bacterium]|nr:DUF362 domain-containing protein [Bacteroidales bacterium]
MNKKVVARKCPEYDPDILFNLISDIYRACEAPPVAGKKVLLKPNLLSDNDPEKCITTHPAVVEAMIRFLQAEGAIVFVGDSPAVHIRSFKPLKSGIYDVCERTGAIWNDFLKSPFQTRLRKGTIKTASIVKEVDLIISIPKLKNHELVYFTGAIKNTLGLVPGFSKAKQHALYQDRNRFSEFLVDLNEAIPQHFFLIDGIMGMEGRGPAQGTPARTGVLIGSVNPLALDIITCSIIGYDPLAIPTNLIALTRGKWLRSPDEIIYEGPGLETIAREDFRRIPISPFRNIALKFLRSRLFTIRKLQRRPVFLHEKCIGCLDCIKICPTNAIAMHPAIKNHVVLTDRKCIRCFCCSEVCQSNAVEVRRKLFGD